MDAKAKAHFHFVKHKPKLQTVPGEAWLLLINGHKLVSNMSKFIYEEVHKNMLKDIGQIRTCFWMKTLAWSTGPPLSKQWRVQG